MRVGRRPTATATTAGATAGPGETLNSLQGRTGNEHRFVCSRNERSLCPPRHTLYRPLCYPLHHRRVAPPRVYLAARFHRYRANRGKPRAQRERERKDEKELAEGGGWVAGSTGLQPRDTTGQRDTLVYSISPSRVHTRFPRAIIRAATR